MSQTIIKSKYDLAPVAEMLRYEEPMSYAEYLNNAIEELTQYKLRDGDACGAQTEIADAILGMRELRDTLRKMQENK